MKKFIDFLVEEVAPSGGHKHIEHISDVGAFDGHAGMRKAQAALRGFHGKADATRKLDDSMSFHATRQPNGHVAVKYKGSGANWYGHDGSPEGIKAAHEQIDKDLKDKPYMAEKLKHLVSHIHKVLPDHPGTWQGGFMHSPESRHEINGRMHFRPNTINYSTPSDSEEGKKIKRSKVGIAIHTELAHPDGRPVPVLDTSHFKEHPDVHMMNHIIPKEESKLSAHDHDAVEHHLKEVENLSRGNENQSHLDGQASDRTTSGKGKETHRQTLRTYINSTVRDNKTPDVDGYKKFLAEYHQKDIDGVKTDEAKKRKTKVAEDAQAHIEAHRKHFENTFKIHHHLEKATDILADHISRNSTGGFHHDIDGKETGPEGAVINGLKIVKRRDFSAANLNRTARFAKPAKVTG